MQSTKFLASAALAAVCVAIGACTPSPSLTITDPVNAETVASPVAVRVGWTPQIQGPFSCTLDSADISAQFTLHTPVGAGAVTNFNEDALLTVGNGTHTLGASASLWNVSTEMFQTMTASSTFTVAPPLFALASLPTIHISPGTTVGTPISIARLGFDGEVSVSLSQSGVYVTPGPGIVTFPAGQNTTTLNVTADPGASLGQTEIMILTLSAAGAPTRRAFLTVSVDTLAAPTFAQIYTSYLGPGSAGSCFNCHSPGGPGSSFFVIPGSDKDSHYAAFTNNLKYRPDPLVNRSNPSASLLLDSANSPVAWFNPNGTMPRGNAGPNVNAKTDITNWVNAGALNNGSLVDGGGGSSGAGGSGAGGSGAGGSGAGGSGTGGQICQGDPCGVDRVCCGDILDDCSCSLCSPPHGECP